MTIPAEIRAPAYHVVMIAFEGTDRAGKVLDRMKKSGSLAGCEIEGEAVVWRDVDGVVHFHEPGAAGVGAVFGTAAAGLLGLVTGPIFLSILLALGAVAGGVAGHYAGQVLPPEDLRRVAESLTPGTSALIVVVDTEHASRTCEVFTAEGRVVVDTEVETEISSVVREAIIHSVRRV